MSVIELNELSKWYDEVIGLNKVTTSIGKGMTGLLGPNGAGKSTLMGLATGQLKPSAGSIRVMGERIWNNPAVLSRIGFCSQNDSFWGNMTGRQFVIALAKMSGLSGAGASKAALEALERTGMTSYMDRRIGGYSKGMRQRCKIAQALAHKPELLILDEPFTGADPIARHDLAELFRNLAADGVDILVSSHVLHEVEALTRRILMIDRGRIVAEGDVQNVRQQLRDRPHAVRLRAQQPRAIAAELAWLDAVSGVRIDADGTLIVETSDPPQVYDRITAYVVEHELDIQELAAADESLEAVFGYLTDRSA